MPETPPAADVQYQIISDANQRPAEFNENTTGGIRRLTNKLAEYKNHFMITAATGSVGYLALSGSMDEAVHGAEQAGPWVAASYAGSIGIYGLGAAIMLVSAGRQINIHELRNIKQTLSSLAVSTRENKFMRLGFWTNTVGALGAATVASAGIVDALPAKSWGLLAAPALDAYSTLAVRKYIYGTSRPKTQEG